MWAVEEISLVDLDPRELAPLPTQLVPKPGEFLFLDEERGSRREPLGVGHDAVALDAAAVRFHGLVSCKFFHGLAAATCRWFVVPEWTSGAGGASSSFVTGLSPSESPPCSLRRPPSNSGGPEPAR